MPPVPLIMSSPPPAPARRSRCARCLRPDATCLCAWIRPVRTAVDLLVLQHPLEVHAAKGSARLLHLSVQGSRLLEGESFDSEQLQALLYAGARTPILLYPDTPDHRSLGIPLPPALPAAIGEPSGLRLVILDGTWRKSRKMLYLNPALQQLPRLSLRAMPPSHYRIRKAHAADQLSTLEAACYALGQLERDGTTFLPLIDAFDGFVDMLAQYQTTGHSPVR